MYEVNAIDVHGGVDSLFVKSKLILLFFFYTPTALPFDIVEASIWFKIRNIKRKL